MKVLVIGTGYVGLVTGVCLAKAGHHVLCVDKDENKIAKLRSCEVPIYEAGLESLLSIEIVNGNIEFDSVVPIHADFDIALIAVGTPSKLDGSADLAFVLAVVDELAAKLQKGAVIAIKSTVPVGTAGKIENRLAALGRQDLRVASVPEFLREGNAIEDTLNPSRLVIGVQDSETEEILLELYTNVDAPRVVCNQPTAEMIKYASNAFLATKISFINEIANICERVDANVSQVAFGMGLDPRIGAGFLRAGLGYGGSCFPKDTRALVNIAGSVDYEFKLLRAVVEVNQRQKLIPIEWLKKQLGNLNDKSITLLGVAFKPGTDDIRESPAHDISKYLEAEGAVVKYCDPLVRSFVSSYTGREHPVEPDVYLGLKGSDAFILITEWEDYINLDWEKVKTVMRMYIGFDGRNILDKASIAKQGFLLSSIGGHLLNREQYIIREVTA